MNSSPKAYRRIAPSFVIILFLISIVYYPVVGQNFQSSTGNNMYNNEGDKRDSAIALFSTGQIDIASTDATIVKRGVTRIQRAAELGLHPAQLTLGTLYETGKLLKKNLNLAASWYRKAAEKGNTVAQTRIGSLYERGLGVERDVKAADHWYRAAAETGYTEAQYNLGMMHMVDEIIEPDYYEGIYWLEKAAKGGYAKAQDALGRAYFQGVGVRKDSTKAIHWFQLAAEQGLPVAQHNLGSIYDKGGYYVANPKMAAYWYKRASEAGYARSMINLADLYRFGDGVPKNLAIARMWYAKAAKSEDVVIAGKAKKQMNSASANIGTEKFGTKDRFLTQGEMFAAIIIVAASIAATSGTSAPPEVKMYSDTVGDYLGDMRDPIQQWAVIMMTDD